MSKKTEEFIDKYIVGKDDWLLKHKDVIAKLLDDYEAEQLTIPAIGNMKRAGLRSANLSNRYSDDTIDVVVIEYT